MSPSSNFDIFSEINLKIYLTQCLLFAHKMNDTFQKEVRKLATTGSPKFKAAPVKMYDRCVVKANTGMLCVTIFYAYVVDMIMNL